MPKGHFVRTEEHKQHIAESTKSSWTEERKRKASERGSPWNVGREFSEEEKLERAIRNLGDGNPFFGRTHTEETKEKIRQAHKGKKIFPAKLRKYGITPEVYFAKKAEGFRWCSGCRDFLDAGRFKHWKNPICETCDSIGKKLRHEAIPLEVRQQKARERYQREKDKAREYKLMKSYGVTLEWYEDQLKKQNGKCACCKGRFDRHQVSVNGERYRLAVDHDHVTGKARKLLCPTCNLNLPPFEWDGFATLVMAYLTECAADALVPVLQSP